jgi:hypothetical protein
MAFPKYLFVIEKKDSDGSKYFMEFTDQVAAAEESDNGVVANYHLLKKNKWEVVKTLKLTK